MRAIVRAADMFHARRCLASVANARGHPLPGSLEAIHVDFFRLVGKHTGTLASPDSATGEVLLSELGNGVSEIVINNPSTRGSLTGSMMLQLARIVDTLCPPAVHQEGGNITNEASTTDVSSDTFSERITTVPPRGLLIRGTGGMFSSGANFDMCTSLLRAPEQGLMMLRCMTDVLTRLRVAPFVSVAIVNGPALGGGAELATAADFRVVHRGEGDALRSDAFLAFVHAKVGVSPGWGGLGRLCSIVGRGNALRLLGTSARCYPNEMIRIGLADAVYTCSTDTDPDTAAREAGIKFLEPFVHAQPYAGSVAAMKRTVSEFCDRDLYKLSTSGSGTTAEAEAFESRWGGPDNLEALAQATKK